MARRLRPRGYPDQNKPACSFWNAPADPTQDPEGYGDPMRTWQRGRCAICGHSGQRMATDHDHETGMVRGRLCSRCNTHEPTSSHPAFDAYRNGANPARILGHVERYYSPFTGWAPTLPPPEVRLAAAQSGLRAAEDSSLAAIEDGTANETQRALHEMFGRYLPGSARA